MTVKKKNLETIIELKKLGKGIRPQIAHTYGNLI
jgi:hypothetical protein